MAHPLVDLCFAPPSRDDGSHGPRAALRLVRTAGSPPPSLAELARRVADGDEHAFELLFRETYPRLVRFAAASVGGDAAADVVVEVFFAIWESRASWSPPDVEAFLYRAVRNRLYNHIRGDTREHRRRDLYAADVTPLANPLDLLDEDPREAAVRVAIAELNPRQRELVVLRWQEERTPAEIATLLGTTLRAVTSLQDRTIAILRRRAPEIFAQLMQR
jgi:RNA polymerase sigma-70 factor (ECF subfamily)